MPRKHCSPALATWTALLACSSFLACSSSNPQPPVELDSTEAKDAGPDALAYCSGANAGCNSVALCGSTIQIVQVATDPPDALGGTIVPGTYSLSSVTVYVGVGGATNGVYEPAEETLVLREGTAPDAGTATQTLGWDDVAIENGDPEASNASGYVTTQGTTISFIETCPLTHDSDEPYTATSTTLKTYVLQSSGGMGELVYTRM